MEWSIQSIAKLAGTTSRTLRHYDDVGLLAPSSIGDNGYRYYDDRSLVRLQRILLLRELGLAIPQIAQILAQPMDEEQALTGHLAWLRQEQGRLTRQIASVRFTIETLRGGEQLMAQDMFDGFDHTHYADEVAQRWGADAQARGDGWWRDMTADDRTAWQRRVADLHAAWISASADGGDPASVIAQQLAARHVEWLRGIPGTPARSPEGDVKAYVIGLGQMYAADPRFAVHYGGDRGATFVRDALRVYAEANL